MIKITKEIELNEFEAWAGAVDTLNHLTQSELEIVEAGIENLNEAGMTETELNDFLWFERELIAYWLGYNEFDEIIAR